MDTPTNPSVINTVNVGIAPAAPTVGTLNTTLALAAGLEGIREKLDPGAPQEDNLYELSPAEFAQRGIQELPRTLDEAVQAFAADPFVTRVLGQGLRDEFITYKTEEWRQYHQQVSAWEIDRYARMF